MRQIITPVIWILALLALVAVVEYSQGRTPFYKNGPVALWSSAVNSDSNSQQIADAYTFSHIIHGFIFYGALTLAPEFSLGTRAVIAIAAESGWEIIENSDFIINRYRAETISLDYYGDSIINSLFDIIAALIGFFIASRLRWQYTVALAIAIEVISLLTIHDNLTLNIIMLLYPIEAIKTWQFGL